MEKYNPFKKIIKGEFSLKEDFRITFSRANLERRTLEGFALILGTGIFLHDPVLCGIGGSYCLASIGSDYLSLVNS